MIIPCFVCGSDKIVIAPAECSNRFIITCQCGDTPHQPGSDTEPMCFVSIDAAIAQWNLRVHGKMMRLINRQKNRIDSLEKFILNVPHSKSCLDSLAYGGNVAVVKISFSEQDNERSQ